MLNNYAIIFTAIYFSSEENSFGKTHAHLSLLWIVLFFDFQFVKNKKQPPKKTNKKTCNTSSVIYNLL